MVSIPKANFSSMEINLIKNKLYDIVNLKYCISIFKYQKDNKTQKLIHMLKYQSKKKIGLFFAGELAKKIEHQKLKFDFIIALPMHRSKEKTRGFNQTKIITNSLSKKIGVPELNIIEKYIDTDSQKKSIYQRWNNQEEKFKLKKVESINGKKILIVDDVITTGATMHSCLRLFENINVTISIACIAYS